MIIGPRFIIATPTKCGTHSFERLAKLVDGMSVLKPMHLMRIPPEFCLVDNRYMLVRDPYERLRSMWTFIGIGKQWGSAETKGMSFRQFLRWMRRQQARARGPVEDRSPWIWTNTLEENAQRFRAESRVGMHAIKIEEADDEVPKLLARHDLVVPPGHMRNGMFHSYSSAGQLRPYRWDAKTVELANACGAADDAFTFGYPVR